MKKCKVCGKHDGEAEFYASISNHCKEHWRERVNENRTSKADYYRSFDRARANLPHRVAARDEYRKTVAFAIAHRKASRAYKERHPERYAARSAVGNAIRDGKIDRLPCIICGGNAEAHHPDYSMPLDVVWLCDTHHKQVHKESRMLLEQAA